MSTWVIGFHLLFPDAMAESGKKIDPDSEVDLRSRQGRPGCRDAQGCDRLLNKARQFELDECNKDPYGTTDVIIGEKAIRYGYQELSKHKKETMLKAEFPRLWPIMERFEMGKCEYRLDALVDLIGPENKRHIEDLLNIGFLSKKPVGDTIVFTIPHVYRECLDARAARIPARSRAPRTVAVRPGRVDPPVVLVLTASATPPSVRVSPRARVSLVATGHQWWWELRYEDADPSHRGDRQRDPRPGGCARDPELRIRRDPQPLGAQPDRQARPDPRPPEHLRVLAIERGVYRGQCAEFCGLQHAPYGPPGGGRAGRRVRGLARRPSASPRAAPADVPRRRPGTTSS